jgi:hypothetical protein
VYEDLKNISKSTDNENTTVVTVKLATQR